MARLFRSIKAITLIIVSKIQRVLIFILLVITYYILFGISRIIIEIFSRRILWPKKTKSNTFWLDAEEYNPKIEDCMRQS